MITQEKKRLFRKLRISNSRKMKLAEKKYPSEKSGVTINDFVILSMYSILKF